ncbi:MAG: DUF5666 domain-containing protein [Candidatus Sumerlaeaceae bacterium]
MSRCFTTRKALARSLVVALMFVVVGAAFANRAGSRIKGTLSGVDLTNSTITVTPNFGSPVTLNVTPATQIKRNGVAATLGDLVVGDRIEAKYDAATRNAIKIEAKNGTLPPPPRLIEVHGTIAAVDVATSSITVTPSSGGADVALTVTSLTVIKCDDRLLTLADIAVGASVEVKYNPTTLEAVKIELKDCGEDVETEVKGTVTAVDAGANSVTVAPKNGAPLLTLSVDASTAICKNGLPATLADIQVGDCVEVHYDPNTLVALKIEVKPCTPVPPPQALAQVEGKLTAVDPNASSVTIAPRRGGPVTLSVDSNTVIKRGNQILTLADLVVGDRVEAKYDRSTLVAVKIEVQRPRWR